MSTIVPIAPSQEIKKNGKPRAFQTSEELWDVATKYFEWCDENPLYASIYDYKTRQFIQEAKKRPFTLMGFCIYAGVNSVWFHQIEIQLRAKGKLCPDDILYAKTLSKIRDICTNQKFEGAATGFFNPMIIARDLGLKDRTDVTSNDRDITGQTVAGMVVDLSVLDDDELAILRKLAPTFVTNQTHRAEDMQQQEGGNNDSL